MSLALPDVSDDESIGSLGGEAPREYAVHQQRLDLDI
jgi:hypothetical protein